MILLADIDINEVCLHSSLWSISAEYSQTPVSLIRLKMLHRTMSSATSYFKTMLQTPESLLSQLGLGSWCGWFYVYVVICKLIFLQENELLGHTQVEDMSGEIENLAREPDSESEPEALMTHHSNNHDTTRSDTMAVDLSGWNALAVVREYNLREVLDEFAKKLSFILPENSVPWQRPKEERENLYAIACLNQALLTGFKKRIDRRASSAVDGLATGQQSAATSNMTPQDYASARPWQPQPILSDRPISPVGNKILPFASFMNFDSINFDGVSLPASTFPPEGQEMLGDWMWDMVMDDFTMPTF
jgi:hypothetical protein